MSDETWTPARAEECSFPSPPSSLLEPTPEDITTTTTATQEGKTEITQVEPDSLFLEITPPDFEDDNCKNGQQLLQAVVETDSCSKPASTEKKGSIGSSNSNESKKDSSGSCSRRDSRNGNGNSLKVDMDKLPYDISISRWVGSMLAALTFQDISLNYIKQNRLKDTLWL